MNKIRDVDAEVYVGEVISHQTLRGNKYVIVKCEDKRDGVFPGTPFSQDAFDEVPECGDWVIVYIDQQGVRHGKILQKV